MEYCAVALVFVGSFGAIDYQSGWWPSKKQAQKEIAAILESKLPAGCYRVGQYLRMRRAEL